MNAEALLRESKLDEAVQALSDSLRDNPGDSQGRVFLFELLCFRGEYERAEKHLALLADGGKDAAAGALLYRAALHAEKLRTDMFLKNEIPGPLGEEESDFSGLLNGRPFTSLADSDERLGARLEVFAAGDYLWVPLRHVASLTMKPPTRLRDLLWMPAVLRMGAGYGLRDLGEVLLPALSPLSFQDPDPQVRLGRRTEWSLDDQGREVAAGQKVWIADGEEISFLEIRTFETQQAEVVAQ